MQIEQLSWVIFPNDADSERYIVPKNLVLYNTRFKELPAGLHGKQQFAR